VNRAQTIFMMEELARLGHENRTKEGYYLPPTPEQEHDLLTRAEAFDSPLVRLWHRFRPLEWRRIRKEVA
jgi:hypothetical protein